MTIPFTFTNESITVIYGGKSHVVQRSSPHFVGLKKAIMEERWDDVPSHLTVAKSLSAWAKGKFTLNGDETFTYDGRPLPRNLNARIIRMATEGQDPTSLFNFFERLNKNPSMRSVEQLYPFLEHQGIAITKSGHILAYKGVNANYTDCHTGTVDNKPGTVNKMPRNQISDDPQQACHEGFHVGARGHAQGYGKRMIVCKVDPENVVCVPYDSSQQKMRVCEYKVIGNYGEDLPDTIEDEEDLAPDAPAQSDPSDETDDAFNGEDEVTVYPATTSADADPALEEGDLETPDDGPTDYDKNPVSKETAGGQEIPKKYEKLAMKPIEELMKQSLDTLRELATYGLKIVGASKIPGGKTALVAKIIEVRGHKE